MSRLTPPDVETMTARQRDVYEAIASGPRGGVRGPLAIWLHRPEFADKAQALGEYCRYHSSLEPRLSELAIVVTARVWGSEFEWQAHKKIALEAGVSPDVIEAVRQHEAPSFENPDEAVVYEFARALQIDRRISQDLYERAIGIIGTDAVVDLTGLLGYYTMISMTLNVFEIDALGPKELD